MGLSIHAIARALFRAGGFGLLALGALDSSPLVFPLGNDLLVLALCARHHERVVYYVLMATLGSLIGCLITDWLSRKGEKALKKFVSPRSLKYFQKHVEKHASISLVTASLLPPPFPFTAVVAVAAAAKTSRSKVIGYVGVGRFMRFAIEAALAVHYGRWMVQQARSPLLEHGMLALIAISLLGSAWAIYKWGWNTQHVPA